MKVKENQLLMNYLYLNIKLMQMQIIKALNKEDGKELSFPTIYK